MDEEFEVVIIKNGVLRVRAVSQNEAIESAGGRRCWIT